MPKDGSWNSQKRELRKRFAERINQAITQQTGEHSWELVAEQLTEELRDPQIMSALWADTVSTWVHEEYRKRSQIEINPQLSLWSQRDLDDGVIMLGDGLAVSYRDATLQHWKRKEENQTQVIDSTTARREATREVIAQLEPEMMQRPDLTTGQWMRERGFGHH
jgi:hypothetical protein